MSIVVASIEGSRALYAYGKGICENCNALSEFPEVIPVDLDAAAAIIGELATIAVALKEFSINFLRVVFILGVVELK
jgi:hypothetical protein